MPKRAGPSRMVVLCVTVSLASVNARAEFTRLGEARIPWDASDRSGERKTLGDSGVRADRLGSMGSGIAYLPGEGVYVMVSDRGPLDGATDYAPRFQTFAIMFDATAAAGNSRPVRVEHRATLIMHDSAGVFSGSAGAFDAAKDCHLDRRLDTEGVRVGPSGRLLTCEEYGPFIDEWTRTGEHVRRISPPEKFFIDHRGRTPKDELPPRNLRGRQPNRGFEGLAVSSDGTKAYALPQGPLLQDGALDGEQDRVGLFVQLLEIDLSNERKTREFVYPLDDAAHGLNELVTLEDGGFIVLEKDGKKGKKARCRKLFRADIDGATDVSGISALPTTELSALKEPVRTMQKTLLLDMLDPRFGLAGESMPEKIEGVTFGPDLPDGRKTLVVTSDNDFHDHEDTRVWVFACEAADLTRSAVPAAPKPQRALTKPAGSEQP